MPLDPDFIIHLKHAKFIQLKTTVGGRSQSSIETDIFQLRLPFNNDLFMSLVVMSHQLLILKDLILLITSSQPSGNSLKSGAAV